MDTYVKYQGKPLLLSKAGRKELDQLDMDTWNVKEILESGFDCSRSRRKPNIIERCRISGNKIRKVVIADVGEYWPIIHAGQLSCSRFKGGKP